MNTYLKKVLLADDHPIILEALLKRLESSSVYQIIGLAKNGKEAWDIFHKQDPEICILDIEMSYMDGIELTEKIKCKNPKTIVILLTMHRSPWIIAKAHKANPNGILLKNMNTTELLSSINCTISTGSYFHPDVLSIIRSNSQEIDSMQSLTDRELEILKLIAEGLTTQKIAEKLFLSVNTIETYRKNLLLKFTTPNMAGLIKKAFEFGIL